MEEKEREEGRNYGKKGITQKVESPERHAIRKRPSPKALTTR